MGAEGLEAVEVQNEPPMPRRGLLGIEMAFDCFQSEACPVGHVFNIPGVKGSRQEEAQRLGRILRPKDDGGFAYFYSIVTRDTRDQEFSANRQLFLTEQGYRYVIEDAEALLSSHNGKTLP